MKNKRKPTAKKTNNKKSSLDEIAKSMREHKREVAESAANGGSAQTAAKPAGGKKQPKKTAKRKSATGGNPKQNKAQQKKSSQKKPAQASQTQGNGSASPKPKSPAKPVSGKTKKAYNKAVKNRTLKSKKRGSRGGNYVLYYLMAAIVAIIVFSVLAKTVLFNCNNVLVEGNQRYTAEEIITLSAIKQGESLLDINTEAAEERIISALAYIDMAEVSKSFPSTIKINITEAERWFAVKQDGKTYIASKLGKILEEGVSGKLPVVIGYEAVEPKVGMFLKSAIDTKTDIPKQVLTAAETAGIKNITTIDMTDRFGILVEVEGRITLELGNVNQLENKLHIANKLITDEISATESVTINITNTDKAYVRDNNIIENPSLVPELPPQETSDVTAEGTAEAGTAE